MTKNDSSEFEPCGGVGSSELHYRKQYAFPEGTLCGLQAFNCVGHELKTPCRPCRDWVRKETLAVSDPVNSPDHYTAGEIECIDAIRSALGREGFRAFCQGNVIKYAWRAQRKGREEDFKKAVWYSRMAIGDDPRERDVKLPGDEKL